VHHYQTDQKIMVISDLHIQSDQDRVLNEAMALIGHYKTQLAALYIIGDLFEYWAGSGCEKRYAKALSFLYELRDFFPVFFMPGNRDFLISSRICCQYRFLKIPDPTIITHGDRVVLLTHGDQLCTHDRSYQWMRFFLQSRLVKTLARSFGGFLTDLFAQRLRSISAWSTKQKPKMVLVADPMAIDHWLSRYDADAMIYGHVHKLAHYRSAQNPEKPVFVLDSWEHQVNFCMIDEQGISLAGNLNN